MFNVVAYFASFDILCVLSSKRGNEAELVNLGTDQQTKSISGSHSSGGSSGSSGWKEGRNRDKVESRSVALKNMLASLMSRETEMQTKVWNCCCN
jgi:hypothetical protein